jgi:plasmid maintenance system antidote protein VapI
VTAIAIVKPVKVRRGHIGGLRAVIDYIKDEEKTNGGKLVYMSGGILGNEFQQMVITKNIFGKTNGRQYAHFIQSFHEKDNLTPETAFQIGREYITALKQWNDFQVVMAVHTNEDHLHIHYIINSVNSKDGRKWQCSKQDLKYFRQQSDELCRKYGLHVIEHGNRGHRSYGEYKTNKQGTSWKQLLATDISNCLQQAKSRADFLHRLDECGLDTDFGTKNVMFYVKAGTYGLKDDRKCSNYTLMSYGDFSKENITNHFKVNKGLLELAFTDIPLLQDAFLEVGRMLSPDNPTHLQDLYLNGMEFADFDRMTREEIETYLKRRKLEQLRKKALNEWEKQSSGSGVILACIADTLALILEDHKEQQALDYNTWDYENEYEL